MSEEINQDRRRFLGTAAMTIAAAKLSMSDMDALKIKRATVAGCDWGARTACIIAALWPECCAQH